MSNRYPRFAVPRGTSSCSGRATMLAGLRAIGERRSAVRRILVYGGSRSLRTSDGIVVLPVARFADEIGAGSLWAD